MYITRKTTPTAFPGFARRVEAIGYTELDLTFVLLKRYALYEQPHEPLALLERFRCVFFDFGPAVSERSLRTTYLGWFPLGKTNF